MRRSFIFALAFVFFVALLPTLQGQKKTQTDWPTFGNDPGGQRYAPLTQINAGNVTKLQGANLHGSTLVALDANTGKLKWHFQPVHHDLWDYDLCTPPTLFDVTVKGRGVPALALMTKMGLLFILDRRDGKPIYGVEERPIRRQAAGSSPTHRARTP